jgi:hypothetical protein
MELDARAGPEGEPMQWLHARIHRDELRALIVAAPIFGEMPPEPLLIACPRCGDEYVADLGAYEEPVTMEEDEWAALMRLDGECPDHAHRFTI